MKQSQKTTITFSMLWIGLMMVLSRPGWVRSAIDFVNGSTATTHIANAGGSTPGGGGGNRAS